MRIENLIYLIGGELKSSPMIKEIKDFSSDANIIKRGHLFFAQNKENIQKAIQKGAYAIVYDGWTQIIDKEIAWIKVDNVQKAALKLLRFFLIKEQIPILFVDDVSFEIAKKIDVFNEILFLDENYIENFITLSKNRSIKISFIKDKNILKELSLDATTTEITKKIKIIQNFIFETTFVYNKIYYERVSISPIFINSLEKVLNIFDIYNIQYNLNNINKIKFFQPHFIDSNFCTIEFGKSDKVIILEKDYLLLKKEKNFLEKNAKWVKKIFISDKKIEGFLYENEFDKIKNILYNLEYNYALLGIKNFDLKNLTKKSFEKYLF